MKKFITSAAVVAMAVSMSANALAAGNSQYFKDVTVDNYGWAVEYVDYIARNGIASGVGSDMYAPGNKIERGDFAILVDKTFGFKGGNIDRFVLRDVNDSDYYAQAIANCCAEGVITEVGAYYPENPITRIDAIKMIYRALNNTGKILNPSMDLTAFSDKASISGVEAQAASATLYSIGLIKGDDKGNLNPNSTMTRAEMAVVFAKLDKYIDEISVKAQEIADKRAEQNKVIEEEKKQQEQETAKADESVNISSDTVNDQVSVTNGGDATIDNSNVVVSGEDAVKVANDSNIIITKTSVISKDANGISASNKAKANVKEGSVTATNGNAVKASSDAEITLDGANLVAKGDKASHAVDVSDGAKVKATDLSIEAGDNCGAIMVSDGGRLELNGVKITAKTGAGKASNTGAIDITADEAKAGTIDLTNVTIDNNMGAAFFANEGTATININGGCVFNTSSLLAVPTSNKAKQEKPSHITINVAEGVELNNLTVNADSKTEVSLNLAPNSVFKGQINPDQTGYVNLSYDWNTTILELFNDLYLDGFENGESLVFDSIVDNGYNIYYNDSNTDNQWLDARTYDLPMGGEVLPYSKYPME